MTNPILGQHFTMVSVGYFSILYNVSQLFTSGLLLVTAKLGKPKHFPLSLFLVLFLLVVRTP